MTREISFNVIGIPQQQGSLKAFVRGNRAMLTSTNAKLRPWRQEVTAAALRAIMSEEDGPYSMFCGPVEVIAVFRMPRPASSPKRTKTLPDKTPDIDKLTRGLFDALTGVVFDDDKRVVSMRISERYTDRNGEQPGVRVIVRELVP